jgi:flavodoxin
MKRECEITRREALRRSLLLSLLGAEVAAASLSSSVAQQALTGTKTLVAYLSRTGNTRVIAGQLQRALNTDLFEIRTAEPYPDDYEETVELARQQREAAAAPPLAARVTEMAGYDTVFLGFPVWGMALPAPVLTFLTTHDLTDKALIPFITHGGYGTGSAPQTVAELAPNSRILDPFVMQADQERETLDRVSAWLRDIET